METKDFMRNKGKYIAINLILFALMYFSVSLNKEYIRPLVKYKPFLGIITGSFPNFIAAYFISLFPIAFILAKELNIRKSRFLLYTGAIIVFIILTIEEVKPFFNASVVYDIYDIMANGLGSIFAILTFELFVRKFIKQKPGN
jgi:glycopeptide antibiotics resistance protein